MTIDQSQAQKQKKQFRSSLTWVTLGFARIRLVAIFYFRWIKRLGFPQFYWIHNNDKLKKPTQNKLNKKYRISKGRQIERFIILFVFKIILLTSLRRSIMFLAHITKLFNQKFPSGGICIIKLDNFPYQLSLLLHQYQVQHMFFPNKEKKKTIYGKYILVTKKTCF